MLAVLRSGPEQGDGEEGEDDKQYKDWPDTEQVDQTAGNAGEHQLSKNLRCGE